MASLPGACLISSPFLIAMAGRERDLWEEGHTGGQWADRYLYFNLWCASQLRARLNES
jgi:hypothetical protein